MNTNGPSLLKTEGDTFYFRKDYRRAAQKYTEAIKEDDSNAILYANRAACYLPMKRYAVVTMIVVILKRFMLAL